MTYNKSRRKPLTKKQRPMLLAAHDSICIYCKLKIAEGEKWQDCHIIARELGGSDDWSNRGPGHIECHKSDTRKVAARIAHGNRLIRSNGPVEDRRQSKHPIRSRGFDKAHRPIPSRPFTKRGQP